MTQNTNISAAPASGSMTLETYYESVRSARENGPLTLQEADRLALAATVHDPAVSRWAAEDLAFDDIRSAMIDSWLVYRTTRN